MDIKKEGRKEGCAVLRWMELAWDLNYRLQNEYC
jgi:hypothetical protein